MGPQATQTVLLACTGWGGEEVELGNSSVHSTESPFKPNRRVDSSRTVMGICSVLEGLACEDCTLEGD